MIDEKTKELYLFNIVAEAKMHTLVQMAKKYMPQDQVRQYCIEMLERAFKAEEIAGSEELEKRKNQITEAREILHGHCSGYYHCHCNSYDELKEVLERC